MTGSTVTATLVNPDGTNGATLGHSQTGPDGSFTLNVPPQTGPVRLTASGGSYVSEMNGATIPASPVSILLSSGNSDTSGISINPLSTFVDTRTVALIAAGNTFTAALTSATSEIEALYGLTTDPGTLVPVYNTTGIDAANLGLILGAIINEDQNLCPTAPGGLVTALSQDISDGVFDGMSGTPPKAVKYCTGNLPAIAGISDFQDALSGLQQLELVTQAFAFGGTGNLLTASGLANIATGGTPPPATAYPVAPLTTIEQAISGAAPTPVPTITPGPPMNTARYDAASVMLPNGDVLIAAGGGNGGTAYLSSIELYISAGNMFANPAALPTMSVGRANETATLLPNGKVLIAGGAETGSTWTNTTDIFDPAGTPIPTITPGPTMNFAREGATAVLLPTGQVLIAGGRDQTTTLNQADLYDPTTNTITTTATTAPMMNVARYDCAAALLPNGNVLIAGGYGSINQGGALKSTEIYDTATNTFAPASSTPTMLDFRGGARATLLPNGKVLIAGGADNTGVVSTTEIYDPVAGTFAPGPNMNSPRRFQSQILLPDGNVLIAGGIIDIASTGTATTDLYNPATGLITAGPTMNDQRGLASIGLLPNGNVLIAGGISSTKGQGIHTHTDLFTP